MKMWRPVFAKKVHPPQTKSWLRLCLTLTQFCELLKTMLFCRAYDTLS